MLELTGEDLHREFVEGLLVLPHACHAAAERAEKDIGEGRVLRHAPQIHWKISLNERNVGKGNGLIQISIEPDGTTWASVRMGPSQAWFLTNTVSFYGHAAPTPSARRLREAPGFFVPPECKTVGPDVPIGPAREAKIEATRCGHRVPPEV